MRTTDPAPGALSTTDPARGAPSTIASWTASLVRALDASGVDGRALAARAGIDAAALESPDARVSRAALTRLWQLAVEATGDPGFGLEAGRHVSQTTFHALGYAVLASATLREAHERIIRYRRVIGDVVQLSLTDVGDRCRFAIDVSAGPGVPFEAVDAFASVCVRQARILRGDRSFEPLRVSLVRPEPPDPGRFRAAFRAPVEFGQPANFIEYARADMDAPLPAGNAEIARANDDVLVRYLARLDDARVSSRVQAAVLAALPDGAPSKQAIARKLGMSPRNLQRRLEEEGTSFKQLLAEARIDLAKSHITEGRSSVTEIAFVLGFADTSAFSRAFKRWTGASPTEFAAREREGHADSPRRRGSARARQT
jgi:AraC-like DNA-binding protein